MKETRQMQNQHISTTKTLSLENPRGKKTFLQFLNAHRRWLLPVSLAAAILVWQFIVSVSGLPAFILPPPVMVWERLLLSLTDGSLLRHTAFTLLEVLLGLFAGATAASVLGYLLAKSRLLENIISPYLIASQAVPVVAIAPLLIIWFGPGLFSKVLICSLTVFFPVLVNTILGMRTVPDSLRDLMRSMHATGPQMLQHLEIPSAMPVLLGGLRIGATLSVIGAVVGELVGSDKGLGFLINVGRGQYDTALVFVAIGALVTMAITLYGTVILLEKHFLRWQRKS